MPLKKEQLRQHVLACHEIIAAITGEEWDVKLSFIKKKHFISWCRFVFKTPLKTPCLCYVNDFAFYVTRLHKHRSTSTYSSVIKKNNKRSIYKEQVELKCYLNPQMNAGAAQLDCTPDFWLMSPENLTGNIFTSRCKSTLRLRRGNIFCVKCQKMFADPLKRLQSIYLEKAQILSHKLRCERSNVGGLLMSTLRLHLM